MGTRADDGGPQTLTEHRPRPPADEPALVGGAGAVVTDDVGREYLDLRGGIASALLGHAHPAVVAALSAPADRRGQVPGRLGSEPAVLLGELLLALTGRGRVLFTGSGAEADAAAWRISRLTGRFHTVEAVGARTSAATQPPAHPWRALPDEVTRVPFGDVETLRAAVGAATALVILEPIQDENGVAVPPPGYLAAAREICTAAGALLAFDEARTSLGRTGHWFHYQGEGVEPDLVLLSHGLGGGLPLGACLAFGPAADLLNPGTGPAGLGGDPVSWAAGLAVIRTIAGHGLLDHVRRVGDRLRGGIETLRHPLVAEVRGAGLLLGIVLTEPVAVPVAHQLRTAGFLVDAVRSTVIRLAPPLILTAAQADAFVAALPRALGGVPVPSSRSRLLLRGAA